MLAGAPPAARPRCAGCAAAAGRTALPAPPRAAALAARRRLARALVPPQLQPPGARRAPAARRRPRRAAAAPPPAASALPSWPPPDVWREFAAAHAGVWDSHAARYGADGALLALPSRYIPSAYAEWGQTMHEWPGRVTAAAPREGRLAQTLERFWPTVGCEFGKVSWRGGGAAARQLWRRALAATRHAGALTWRGACAWQDDVAETEAQVLFADAGVCTAVMADGAYWRVASRTATQSLARSGDCHTLHR
jgi:hypothetical protein